MGRKSGPATGLWQYQLLPWVPQARTPYSTLCIPLELLAIWPRQSLALLLPEQLFCGLLKLWDYLAG